LAVILQDGFLGVIIGAILIKYNKEIAYTVKNFFSVSNYYFWKHLNNSNNLIIYKLYIYIKNYTIQFLRLAVDWLMDTPAGLKLNKELDSFLGDLFLWLIQIWSSMYFL